MPTAPHIAPFNGEFLGQHNYQGCQTGDTAQKLTIINPNKESPLWGIIVTEGSNPVISEIQFILREGRDSDIRDFLPAAIGSGLHALYNGREGGRSSSPVNTHEWINGGIEAKRFDPSGNVHYQFSQFGFGFDEERYPGAAVDIVENMKRRGFLTGNHGIDSHLVDLVREALEGRPLDAATLGAVDTELAGFARMHGGRGRLAKA
jgi:hypothetical protein